MGQISSTLINSRKRSCDEIVPFLESPSAKRQKRTNETSTTSISDLPPNVLQKILEFAVDGSNISTGFLNLTLVCQQWNRAISESDQIMEKLRPKIILSRSTSIENVSNFSITRQYRALALSSKHPWTFTGGVYSTSPFVILLTISSSLTQSLRSLSFHRMSLTPYYFGALKSLELLESLTFDECMAENITVQPIELQQLKMLELIEMGPSQCILNWLKCKSLATFKFLDQSPKSSVDTPTVNFLNQLEHLDELECQAYGWDAKVVLTPKFTWSRLTFELPLVASQLTHVAAASIVTLGQASTLFGEASIILESKWLYEFDEFLVAFLNSCRKIRVLMITGSFPIRKTFDSLRVMNEVEKLEIGTGGSAADLSGLRDFMEKLPNINDAILDLAVIEECVSTSSQDFIAFQNLHELTVRLPLLPCDKFRDISDDPVSVESTRKLWKFCAFNSSLEHVKIKPTVVGSQWWRHTWRNGIVEENSLICLYNDWTFANRSAVRSCSLMLTRHGLDKSKGLRKSRHEKEIEVFGRALSEDEKSFYAEIVIDGWND